jgi:hypothetical protein
MLINIGFVLNKVYILDTVLEKQFLENSRRFVKARNEGLFSIIKLFNLILTLKLK